MSKKNFRWIAGSIAIIITGFVLKAFNEYSVLLNNKLALLQLNNNNADYVMYKLLSDNKQSVMFAIAGIGLLSTYLLVRKNLKNLGGNESE